LQAKVEGKTASALKNAAAEFVQELKRAADNNEVQRAMEMDRRKLAAQKHKYVAWLSVWPFLSLLP
jgi:hypothetical protein